MAVSSQAYIFFAVFLCGGVESYTNAKRKWQLGDTAGAWEVEKKYDAVYPTLSDPIKVGSGHPSLSFKAFFFDGSSDYVELKLDDGDLFKTFAVIMLVYPETTSGPLLHYKYDSDGTEGTDGLDDITITADNGDVLVSVRYGNDSWSFVDTSVLSAGNWQYVIFNRDKDSGELGLNVNGSSSIHPGPITEYLGAPGTLFLGINNDTGNYFAGKITCVLLFTKVISDIYLSDAYDECNRLSIDPGPTDITDVDDTTFNFTTGDQSFTTAEPLTESPPAITTDFPGSVTTDDGITTTAKTGIDTSTVFPSTTDDDISATDMANSNRTTYMSYPTIAVSISSTSVDGVALWRLDDTTYVHSIDGVSPIYPSLSQCVRLADGCPDIAGRKALMLDGASVSYFDLELSSQVIQGDFQIAFKVRPGFPSTGTILHCRYIGSELGVREAKLSVLSTDVSFTLSDEGATCGEIRQENILQPDIWHHVMIERRGTGIGLVVDSVYYTATHACSLNSANGSGFIRLGNSIDGDDVFRGSITCLGVYNSTETWTDRQTSHRIHCLTWVPALTTFETDLCKQIPEMRDIDFTLEKRDAEPHHSLSPLTTYTTSSIRHCGRFCIETTYCIAFTMEVILPNDRECKLYDFVARNEGLVDILGTNYYVIRYSE